MKYVLILAILLTSMLVSVAHADVNFNNTDSWSGTSGSMIPHGDGLLRAPPSVTTGLVSYWNPVTDIGSGSTLLDIWGSNDGTLIGASWNATSGMLEFDGTNDYVDCGNDSSLNLTDMSIIIDIVPKSASTSVLIWKGTDGTGDNDNSNYMLFYTSSAWYYRIGDSYTVVSAVVYESPILNSKQLVGLKYGSSQMYLAVDDEVDTTSTSISPYQSDGKLRIGVDGALAYDFTGEIGRLLIYNTELSVSQLNEGMYNYHTSSSYVQIDSAQDAGVGNVWDTIEVTGTDVSSNTSLIVYVDGSYDNVVFNGLELIGTYDVNDLVDIPVDKEYRYAKFKIISTTTYQPETNVIDNIEITTGLLSNVLLSEIYVLPYSSEAYVMWTPSRLSNNFVEYSLNSDMSASSYSTWDNTTTEPTILLTDLTRDTTYYYEVTSDSYGDSITSSTLNFTTQNNTHGFSKYFDRAFVVNDIDGWSVGQSMFEAYADSAGEYITWTLILGSVFLAITIRTESVIIPAVLALISAVVVFPLLPPEHDIPAKVLLGLAISGIIWHQFIGRR